MLLLLAQVMRDAFIAETARIAGGLAEKTRRREAAAQSREKSFFFCLSFFCSEL